MSVASKEQSREQDRLRQRQGSSSSTARDSKLQASSSSSSSSSKPPPGGEKPARSRPTPSYSSVRPGKSSSQSGGGEGGRTGGTRSSGQRQEGTRVGERGARGGGQDRQDRRKGGGDTQSGRNSELGSRGGKEAKTRESASRKERGSSDSRHAGGTRGPPARKQEGAKITVRDHPPPVDTGGSPEAIEEVMWGGGEEDREGKASKESLQPMVQVGEDGDSYEEDFDVSNISTVHRFNDCTGESSEYGHLPSATDSTIVLVVKDYIPVEDTALYSTGPVYHIVVYFSRSLAQN